MKKILFRERRKVRNLALAVLGILLLAALYLCPHIYQVYNFDNTFDLLPPTSLRCQGLWLGHRWYDDRNFPPVTTAERNTLARRCLELGVQDLYIHVGPISSDGHLPPLNLNCWQRTLQALHAFAPRVRCWAWIGAPHAAFLGPAPDTLDLADENARQTLWNRCRDLKHLGFTGLHIDVEPIADGDSHFLTWLEAARQQGLSPLSVAGPQLQPPGLPTWFPGMNRLWSARYYREVSQRADQVCLMGYDTFQPNEEMYRRYLAHQVRQLRLLTEEKLVVGVPTYEDNPPYHRPDAETLSAGIEGARRGGCRFVSVYAEWTTDAREWAVLKQAFALSPKP